jgi:hypothetical protein
MPMRADDPKELSFFRDRSRIDKGGTGWIVRTREGTRGPFATETEAWAYASIYADTARYLRESGDRFPAEIDASDIEVIEITLPRWR